jgi:hypothetical protein
MSAFGGEADNARFYWVSALWVNLLAQLFEVIPQAETKVTPVLLIIAWGNVRCWHKADIPMRSIDVRFWG